jgi:transcriptional regulator with PAS, ATPase and Fis domain
MALIQGTSVTKARDGSGGSRSEALEISSFVQEEDLEDLRPLLQVIEPRLNDVLASWFRLYSTHMARVRSLSENEFVQVFGGSLAAMMRTLREKQLTDFAANARRLGEHLAEREVPVREIVALLHLNWMALLGAYSEFSSPTPRIHRALGKVSHARTMVLCDAYFQSWSSRFSRPANGKAALPEGTNRFHGLVGAAVPMRQLYQKIRAAGATRGTVLIVGESGTGKELIARAIHESSPAPGAPFVALNCAAVARELIESEMFGYLKGAFSGANADRPGLFRAAQGGTLFLDEITEMSPDTQAKLLRSIQERTVRPVGATREVPVDVRIIASTNRDPEQAVREGQLRRDLYYRLQASVVRVPPLRERVEDIPLLVDHFISLFNERITREPPIVGIEASALEEMKRHGWPGNVRELSNAIEGVFTFGESSMIGVEDLPHLRNAPAEEDPPAISPPPAAASNGKEPAQRFEEVERDLIRKTLERTGGNKARAAHLLGISRKKLYARIARYGLESCALS